MGFAAALRRWFDFFLATGIASAALLGFFLLGLSQRHGSSGLEGQTIGFLLGLLVASLLVLVPDLTPRALGIPLLVAGILGAVFVGRDLVPEVRGRLKTAGPAFIGWRLLLTPAAFILAIVGAIMMMGRGRSAGLDGMYFLCASMLALLLIVVRNAWELFGHPGQDRVKLHRSARG